MKQDISGEIESCFPFASSRDTVCGQVTRVGQEDAHPAGPRSLAWAGADHLLYLHLQQLAGGFRFEVRHIEVSTGVDQEVKLDSGMTEAVQVIGSPDGQWLAVAEFGGNIWLLALDDVASGSVQSSWRAVASEPGPVSSQFIAWSEDGWIFVHRNTGTGEEHEIRRINQSSGESELHARVPVDCVHVSMDADGRTFVCDVWTSDSDIWIAEGRQGAR